MDKEIKNKKGQLAVWVIIAILIVGAVLVIFIFDNDAQTTSFIEENPKEYIINCLEEESERVFDKISLQGGYVHPIAQENYIRYNTNDVAFLCYTEEEIENCVNQEPMLFASIENEIKTDLIDDVNKCFKALEDNYKQRNYDYIAKSANLIVDILPGEIRLIIDKNITITKVDTVENYNSFDLSFDYPMNDFILVTNRIINAEASSDCAVTNGNADIVKLQRGYTGLELGRFITGDNDKIYTIKDIDSEKEFTFAVRNCRRLP